MEKQCNNCGESYNRNPRFSDKQWANNKYCSLKCSAAVNGKKLVGTTHTKEWREKMSKIMKGRKITWGNKISKSSLGKKLTAETIAKMVAPKIGKPLSESHKMKLSASLKGRTFSVETRKKLSDAHKGNKSYLWRGGTSSANKIVRRSLEFKLWREAVFLRDDWTCQECTDRGGELHPHHIKPFALFPELRFAIDNGITLCKSCHMKTETWGKRLDLIKHNAN